MAISASEAHYLVESCLEDLRPDGRGRLEHRPYSIAHKSTRSEIDARDVSSAPALILSNGSSRVHLPGSSTDVLCSVKADLVHPSPSKPNEGVVELGVDLSLCGGGGTIGGAGGIGGGGGLRQRRQRREEESQISSLLQRLVLPHAVDYGKLAVWPGKYVWRLAVDVVVVRCDGCVLDAASIAIREALGNTRLPKVSAVMEGNDDGGGSSRNDLMVDGDIKKAVPPAGAENCPLVVTVSVLTAPHAAVDAQSGSKSTSKRRRHVSIVDARAEEEACASSRVCVSVDPSGNVCGVHTLGGGGVVLDEGGGGTSSIPMAMLGDVVSSAATAAGRLYKLLEGERGGDSEGGLRKRSAAGDDGYGYLLKNHFLIQ